MVKKHRLPPNPSRLIEGLRDTGYEFNTSLADIVDNSIDAEATEVSVSIDMDFVGNITISVADNGYGMDEDDLLNAMTYGSLSRKVKSTLGKFGLGLKTASTAFCRGLSVISRASGDGPLIKAIWDLEHVVDVNEWELLVDEPTEDEIERFEEVAKGGSGTLVVWEKVDRLLQVYAEAGGKWARIALGKIVDSFRFHAGMVYQRFLDEQDERARNIKIELNGDDIKPWDPFCSCEKGTELVAEGKDIPIQIGDNEEAKCTVRAYVLPRREEFSSASAADRARLTNDRQGVYIYRENRLIHPADWLNIFRKEPHITLLRVEFSFDHHLDDAFYVDIKKSRILLDEGLFDWFQRFLGPPRNAANERYRKGQQKKAKDVAKDAHDSSNVNIKEKEIDLRMADVDIKDKDKNSAEITNKYGRFMISIPISDALKDGELYVQPAESITDGVLWEPCIIDQHHAVRINRGHAYYDKVYVPNLASGVTIQGMDSLLWALSEAELGTITEKTKMHFEELRYEVSRILRRLVADMPEPDLEEENNA